MNLSKTRKALLLILVFVLVSSLSLFLGKQWMENKARQQIKLLKVAMDNNLDFGNIQQKTPKIHKNFSELKVNNNDLVAWLCVEKSDVALAVMQTKFDEEYYLRRNFHGDYDYFGTLFMSEGSRADLTSENTVIYGHNVESGEMFGFLEDYRKAEYLEENPYIQLLNENEYKTYKIFAVYEIQVNEDQEFHYDKINDFNTNEDYDEYLNQLVQRSLYDQSDFPKNRENLLTLSTCDYSKHNNRLVVVAYEWIGESGNEDEREIK